jgi:hypothetical protein
MSEQQWVRNSLRRLAQALVKRKFRIGKSTVRRLLKKLKLGLMSNRKSLTGEPHPESERQFRYIKRVKRLFLQAGLPVISVDTKKKELIGAFHNKGRSWRREAEKVNVHDFPQDALGQAVPYGIYDLTHNQGYVFVGTSADTAEFAVHAITQWWQDPQRPPFAREDALLILCDAGGSNNCRYWLWKHQLQQHLADHFGITVMVCHYPTGASKYNPVEYRLFSQISLNWAGKPLRSWATVLNLIRHTTTQTGLTVKAFLVERIFEKERKVSPTERKAIRLKRRSVCPQWNYMILPSSLADRALVKC